MTNLEKLHLAAINLLDNVKHKKRLDRLVRYLKFVEDKQITIPFILLSVELKQKLELETYDEEYYFYESLVIRLATELELRRDPDKPVCFLLGKQYYESIRCLSDYHSRYLLYWLFEDE